MLTAERDVARTVRTRLVGWIGALETGDTQDIRNLRRALRAGSWWSGIDGAAVSATTRGMMGKLLGAAAAEIDEGRLGEAQGALEEALALWRA